MPRARSFTRHELTVVAGVHALLVVVITWPLASRMGSALPGDLGDPLLAVSILGWDASRLAAGLAGLWDAPIFFPFKNTLAYSEHLLGIALFTAPVQWISGNPVAAYNAAFLAAPILAGTGAYALAKSLWGRQDGAWIAGIAFAFAPHRLDHASHLHVLMSGWMPVALFALHRYFQSGSRRALAGFVAAFCLQGLSNGYFLYFFAMVVVVVGGSELLTLVSNRLANTPTPKTLLRTSAELAAGAIVICLVFVPVARAYYEVQTFTGLRRTSVEAEGFSARSRDYLRAPEGLRIWGPVLGQAPAERSLFPGLTIVLLAALGLLTPLARTRRVQWPAGATRLLATYALVAAGAYWLSLGPRGGAYGWLMSVVPGFDGLRVPARFIVVISLALAVLGAAGAGWLCGRIARRGVSAGLVISLCALMVAEGYGPLQVVTFRAGQRQRAALHSWLAAEPPGAILELPIASPDLAITLSYQYATLLHGRPIVNGYSGWGSPIQDFLADPEGPFSRPGEMDALLEGLSALGVRHVVLHRSEYSRQVDGSYSDPQPLFDALEQSVWTEPGRAFFPSHAWPLKTAANGASRAAGLGAQPLRAVADPTVTASRESGLGRLTDGDPRSIWATTQTGDEWINVALPQVVDVAAVEIGLRVGGARNYPSRLRIESTDEAGRSTVLVERTALPLVLGGLAQSPRAPTMTLELPANRSVGIRIRQTGAAPWPWEVSDLRVWRR